ncbi:L-lactate dehydrogenase [Candidatus Woesebacteria bacterium]|nr:L-lactate dehydrogenase [Candidatus Woesebacteria bacterium]
MKDKNYKISIVGCGKVGMTTAYSILHDGIVNELLLVGRDKSKIIGEQLDLEHGLSFLHHAHVEATDDYADVKGSDLVIVTAGAAQGPGDTRLDLANKNLKIIEEAIPQIVKHSPESIILIVSNPVDLLTYKAYQLAGLPKGRIFGSGTTLDTARFRFHLSEFLKVNPRSIHAYILGEHGDHSFPVISSASVGGQPLTTMPDFSTERAEKAYTKAKNAAYKIIASKGATYYAIGAVVAHISRIVLTDAKSILPVSIPLHGYKEISGIALSVPCIVGREGVEKILDVKMSWDEKKQLQEAADTLKKFL